MAKPGPMNTSQRGSAEPTGSPGREKNAIGCALAAMRLPGTWEVWQASFQNDRRFWLFDPCSPRELAQDRQRTGTPRTSSRAASFSNGWKRRGAGQRRA